MGFYLRCRRLQSGAATQTDSGGRLMAKVPGFAKVYAGRWAHRRNGHQATFANAAGFFNNLLVPYPRRHILLDASLLFRRYRPLVTVAGLQTGPIGRYIGPEILGQPDIAGK